MSELQRRLEKLTLRLDYMGMRCEQAVADAIDAIRAGDVDAGLEVDWKDSAIDSAEVEIEQECIRLLALYQPAAVDLRTICTIIKANNDLERIADLGANMGRQVEHLVAEGLTFEESEDFNYLAQKTLSVLNQTIRLLSTRDTSAAKTVIESDKMIDEGYARMVQGLVDGEKHADGIAAFVTAINVAKALERIGDHCTNIAEDIIFLKTGDIVRHALHEHDRGEQQPGNPRKN